MWYSAMLAAAGDNSDVQTAAGSSDVQAAAGSSDMQAAAGSSDMQAAAGGNDAPPAAAPAAAAPAAAASVPPGFWTLLFEGSYLPGPSWEIDPVDRQSAHELSFFRS